MAGRDAAGPHGGDNRRREEGLNRRAYLGCLAALATAAGCSGRSETGESPATATATPTKAATPTLTATGTEESEPTETGTAEDPVLPAIRVENDTVRQTRPATVAVDVANRGDGPVDATVTLTLSHETRDTMSVRLEAESTETLTFELRDPRVGEGTLEAAVSVDGNPQDTERTAVTVEPYPSSFVDREGSRFVTDDSTFQYVGVNNNHLPVAGWGRQYVDRLFESLAARGVSVVRTWGFPPAWTGTEVHPEPGTFRDEWFDHFDSVILAAKRRGIRLVLPLLNNWGDASHAPTPAAYADWSPTAETKNDFFGDEQANQYFRNYVEYLLTHHNQLTGVEYRNDPTIMMWEVGNEIEYHGDRRGEPLTEWYDAAARHIKSIDDTHLVGSGMHGATGDVYERWNIRNASVETHQSDAIDACSFHCYPAARSTDDGVSQQEAFAEYVRTHVREAHEQVGKPAYFGEFGVPVGSEGGPTVADRNEFLRTATRVAREERVDGLQYWFAELRDPKDVGARRTHEDNPLALFPDESETWAILEEYANAVQ